MTNENKDHLNINLDFLDKKDTPTQPTDSKQASGANSVKPPTSSGKKYKWRNILIVVGIILFVGWLIVANSGDSSTSSSDSTYIPPSNTDTSTTANNTTANGGDSSTPSSYVPISNTDTSTTNNTTTNDNLIGASGETYSCSDDNYDKATALEPNSSDVASLNADSTSLDSRSAALKIQSSEIDATTVDQSDQSSIDAYNAAVDDYNTKLTQLQADDASWNQRNAVMNTQIDTYNNFLDANCTPQ